MFIWFEWCDNWKSFMLCMPWIKMLMKYWPKYTHFDDVVKIKWKTIRYQKWCPATIHSSTDRHTHTNVHTHTRASAHINACIYTFNGRPTNQPTNTHTHTQKIRSPQRLFVVVYRFMYVYFMGPYCRDILICAQKRI